MTAGVLIRPANRNDTAGILRCLSCAFAAYRQEYTTAAFLDTILDVERLHARMQEMYVLVATSEDEVIGSVAGAALGNGEGHLRGMAVLPGTRGSGVAAQLLTAIEDYLRHQGCTRISLDTTEPLRPAMRFYEKHGYKRSESTSDFFGMTLLEYVKDLH